MIVNWQERIGAVILAGGENRRMHGEKKLFLPLDGYSFLERVRKSFEGLLPVYLSVEEEEPYRQTGLELITDLYPGTGPLGGICTAMQYCKEEALFIAACDMPFLQRQTVEQILETYRKNPGRITLAWQDGKCQPLLGIYPRDLAGEILEQMKRQEYSLKALLEGRDLQFVQLEEKDLSAQNLNSSAEYARHFSGRPLQIEEAISMLRSAASVVREKETISLGQPVGRILAEDIIAEHEQPPFARSPLDGYALRTRDTKGAGPEKPVRLKVIGKIYAGQVYEGTVGAGQCVRLMTGAPIPAGADTVIRQEDTDFGTEEVQIFAEGTAYKDYCPAGEDYRPGDLLLRKGSRIGAAAAAVAAGAGFTSLQVYRRPKVAVISTGDEIIPAGQVLEPGKIYDTNLPYVTARLEELGGTQVTGLHCQDSTEEMADLIRSLAKHNDLIITTGGVSVGEKDIMHAVLERLGGQKLFWKVRIKPGAPTLAFITEGTLVICLTGNPYGVMVNFELLIRPVLEKISCGAVLPGRKEKRILAEDSAKKADVRRFLKGMTDGEMVCPAKGPQGAGTIASMALCNCLIELPAQSAGKKGEEVWVHIL